ncbi:MAG TPA: tetratricopeptide repeat protein [Thermoanaerobaculia bacterium]|jgi:tetratricopeptide (TPR) repeat protein
MSGNTSTTTEPWGQREWGIVAGLVALVAIVFAQVWKHEFLNYDDPQFVFFNEAVRNADFKWAFTSTSLTWLPLTWISYMIDFRIFGLQPGGYLIMNVLYHALATCFLFAALRRMTAATWPSAFVAAVFAIHPAHVESVAWIAERKDVLSTLFAILALFFYARRKLWLTAAMMALSLMAKQTYVTLPLILILLDYWPLQRWRRAKDLGPLLIEKLPLFVLTIAGSVVAVAGQVGIQSVSSTSLIPVARRVANAFVAYAKYTGKMFLPVRLAVLYPLVPVAAWKAIAGVIFFLLVTGAAIALRKRAPYFLVGWLWFVGALVPVIGLIQIGGQAMADRYTYFAFIGLTIAAVWGAMALPVSQHALARTAAVVLLIFAAMAWRQVGYWKSCDTLFSHTIAVTGDNAIAEYSLGQYLQFSDPKRALTHLRRAIDLGAGWADKGNNPLYGWFVQSHVAASTALLMEARNMPPGTREATLRDAIAHARRALEIDPKVGQAPGNIALAERVIAADTKTPVQQQAQGSAPPAASPATPQPRPAPVDQQTAQKVMAALEKGTAFSQQGKLEEAVGEYRKAVTLAPRAPETHIYLALGLLQAKHGAEGISHLRAAKAIDAKLANDILTQALHMQPDPNNLDMFIAQFQGR